jgi:predicted Zn-dependent protease
MSIFPFRLAVIAGVSASLALAACGERAPNVDLDAVKAMVANHQYRKAEQQLAAFEAVTGGTPRSHRLMIDTLLGLGDGFAAEVYLNKLSSKDITDSDRKTLLAHSLIVRDRPFDAIEVLTEQLPKARWTSETYRIAIWAHRAYDQVDAANQQLAEGLAAFPRNGQLLALQSRNMLDNNDVEGANEFAARALESDPRNFEARLISAEIALRQARIDDALLHYRAANSAFPDEPLPLVNIVGILIDQGRLAEAKPVLTKALAANRDYPLLVFQQARLEALNQDYLAAQRTLNSAWGNLENYVPAQILSARVSVKLGNRATAESMLDRASQDPRFADEISKLRAEFGLQAAGL